MKSKLKTTCFLLFAVILSSNLQTILGQNTDPDISEPLVKSIGIWKGSLMFQNTELPMVFKVHDSDQNNLKVTLDSPLQNAYDIPLGEISNTSGEIKIDAPMLQGNYTARFINDSTLNGTWYQAGNSFPLKLVKSNKN